MVFLTDRRILTEIRHPARNIPSDFDASVYYRPRQAEYFLHNEVLSPCYDNTVYKINSDSIYPGSG
jgi:hypothetical protein